MILHEQINNDLKIAMKSGDMLTRDVLRLVCSEFKNEIIDRGKRDEGLSEKDCIVVIRRLVKQRKDSVKQYRDGNRNDLADKEELEIEILNKYLPAQMSDDAVGKMVQSIVAELGANGKEDMGKVMGKAMKTLGERADGAVVKKAVDELLS